MKSNKVSIGAMFNTQKKLTQAMVVGSICALTSTLSYANSLGLQDVYQMALQHDALLAQAQSQYQADMQGLDTARASLLPQIQADGSYFVNDSTLDSADVASRGLSLTLNQSLYKHEYWARYEQSKYLVEAADSTLKNAQQDLILRVSQAYFDVLLAQETVRLAKSKEVADYTQYETAQASAELGLSSKVDVLQAKSSYDLSKSETINAENGLDVALEVLSKLTGKSVTLFESGQLKQLLPDVDLPIDKRATSQLEKRAETENLLVKQAQSQLSTATEEIEVQRAGYWPTVAFQASYSDTAYSDYNSAYATSYNDNNKTSVGVTLSLPLYSGGSTSSQVAAAKYKTIASQQALRDAQETARLNVRTQKRNLERGQKLVAALREAVKSNDAFLESAEEGYKVGLKSMLEVLTARTNQNSAHRNLIEAIHNQVLSQLNLEASLGDLTIDDILKYEPLLQAKN
ncbi:TolC family outer membrane protein [Thiomicrorhabdus sp. Kp2]|uniref:TolC family outer membrane protein n=1 Tax=Thiomicrorhabdus sp. Kp2 TaxID=1123518 RepID=UPI0003FB4749|nr:TolC family outer membrane protein [Thiomicrorhabdus sp. Kp2]